MAEGSVLFAVVALRKESVDRNGEIKLNANLFVRVALRKESVDRNNSFMRSFLPIIRSLSARRAWIEIRYVDPVAVYHKSRSPQGERG